MKLTKKLLRKIKIINAHDYSDGNPFIWYRPQSLGRASQCAAWMIHWPGHAFKESHWHNYGDLSFDVYDPRSEKADQLLKAQERFKEIFHYDEIMKTPFGTWMEKGFVEQRNQQLKKILKEKMKNELG